MFLNKVLLGRAQRLCNERKQRSLCWKISIAKIHAFFFIRIYTVIVPLMFYFCFIQLYALDLNGYWAAERKIVDSRYKDMIIPYNEFTRYDFYNNDLSEKPENHRTQIDLKFVY